MNINKKESNLPIIEPLISVIVPVYKAEQYLDRCVNSILNQTYRNIELVLIEDGSPDNSGKLCDEWRLKDNRVVVIHKENGGASSARNVGLQVATGEYICFVDSDDWIEQHACKRWCELILQYHADMVISEAQIIDGNIKKKKQPKVIIEKWEKEKSLDYFFRINGEHNTHSVCERLIKRNVLNGFRFIEGKMNEDVHACYYMAAKSNTVVYTNELLYNYFINTQGTTNSKFTEKRLDLIYMWDQVKELNKLWTPEYGYACEMNSKRARFTLLSQMKLNGFDKNNANLIQIKKELKKEVRKSYFDLLKWKMPLSRKILLTIMTII